MLDTTEVNEVARAVATAAAKSVNVIRVTSTPDLDWTGGEMLRIVVVVEPGYHIDALANETLGVLVGVSSALQERGEERFPLIHYRTEAELAADDDPEE